MRTHIEFKSPDFPAYPGEEEDINPGRYGKRLAEFLHSSLANEGFAVGEIYSEDWGWAIPIHNDAFPLWIGCGNYEEFENGFLCFIEPSKPFVRRLFRKIDTTAAVEKLAAALERVLAKSQGITELRWWPENQG
ncbi:hypothetical protein [Geothrix mesophila]|uniref:hypothetical protein n=1 Tax=Geothrix mesophila TaxID=2922723 RepID=UPI001FACD8A1|nr:hypothetical protein [Geothrix sp. SG198]